MKTQNIPRMHNVPSTWEYVGEHTAGPLYIPPVSFRSSMQRAAETYPVTELARAAKIEPGTWHNIMNNRSKGNGYRASTEETLRSITAVLKAAGQHNWSGSAEIHPTPAPLNTLITVKQRPQPEPLEEAKVLTNGTCKPDPMFDAWMKALTHSGNRTLALRLAPHVVRVAAELRGLQPR